jgi:hypothetical protein
MKAEWHATARRIDIGVFIPKPMFYATAFVLGDRP